MGLIFMAYVFFLIKSLKSSIAIERLANGAVVDKSCTRYNFHEIIERSLYTVYSVEN